MRDAFFDELRLLFSEDSRVVFITGDLGYKLFTPLLAIDSARVINFGIREGAMVGFAAGLAKTGFIPFVYSIVPFLTLKCLEQIKLDLCYNMCRVILVGVGGGYSYGPNGPTHHGVEDIAILSTLPNMQCWTPATPTGVRQCVRRATAIDSPAYIRLGRNGEPDHTNAHPTEDSHLVVRNGSNGIIIALGTILDEVLSAARKLGAKGLHPTIVLVSSIKPFPESALLSLLSMGGPVLTVEEHVVAGGLGQQLGFAIAKSRCAVVFDAITAPDRFPDVCMSRSASLAWANLSSDAIVARFLHLHSCSFSA